MAKNWRRMSEAQLMKHLEIRGGKSMFGGKQIIELRFPSEWVDKDLMKRMEILGVGIDGHKYDIDIKRVS